MRRNIHKTKFLVTLLLLCAGIARAQVTLPSSAPATPDKNLATVYVYRLDEGIPGFWFLMKRLPVYLGERLNTRDNQKKTKIAMLKNKHYFMVRLTPGKYVVDTKWMWRRLELEVSAGGEYYLRLDRGNDCPDEHFNITSIPDPCEASDPFVTSVAPERWRAEKLQLRPIKAGDVKARKLVIIPPG